VEPHTLVSSGVARGLPHTSDFHEVSTRFLTREHKGRIGEPRELAPR